MADTGYTPCACSFIPSYVFQDITASDDIEDEVKDLAQATLDLAELEKLEKELEDLLAQLDEALPSEQAEQADQDVTFEKRGLRRQVYSLANKTLNLNDSKIDLVGQAQLIRYEASPASAEDAAANKCYENFGYVYEFFSEFFARNSIDDKGMPLVGIVHYGTNVANALWDPARNLMWFGDGFSRDSVDATKPSANFAGYFGNFYDCLDLVAHELTHGITTSLTRVTAGPCDSGALVEHIADVFGIMVKQHKLKHTVNDSDWLIGQEIVLPELKDMALRSFKNPGNAYVLPGNLGRDKQVAHYKQYVAFADQHINSGILNHAFYLAAMDIGGYSWDKIGKIWWKTLAEGKLNLVQMMGTWVPFARKTVEFAQEYGEDAQKAVSNAWQSVGIQI